MSSCEDYITNGIQHAQTAVDLDLREQFSEALREYIKCLDYFIPALKHENPNARQKHLLREKCGDVMNLAEDLQQFITIKKSPSHCR